MFQYFKPDKHYTSDGFKIVNQNYSVACKNKFVKNDMHMKTFLYILKLKLNEKYPNIDFKFYILRRSKNVNQN